ncbi:hypothetical protein K438DRAFT_1797887 [Mycena galopus ATCC 62051]|nr:hypothetical protein K438DRAFT_1797887 [Mycena galopus ATCC 62051]
MWLAIGPRNALLNDDHVRKVTRILFALKEAIADSQIFPDSLLLPLRRPTSPSQLEDRQEKRFKHVASLERHPTCVTFRCPALEDDADIVVKFVRSYDIGAHRLLGEKGLAPHCGPISSQVSYSEIKMVAGKTLSWLQANDSGCRTT